MTHLDDTTPADEQIDAIVHASISAPPPTLTEQQQIWESIQQRTTGVEQTPARSRRTRRLFWRVGGGIATACVAAAALSFAIALQPSETNSPGGKRAPLRLADASASDVLLVAAGNADRAGIGVPSPGEYLYSRTVRVLGLGEQRQLDTTESWVGPAGAGRTLRIMMVEPATSWQPAQCFDTPTTAPSGVTSAAPLPQKAGQPVSSCLKRDYPGATGTVRATPGADASVEMRKWEQQDPATTWVLVRELPQISSASYTDDQDTVGVVNPEEGWRGTLTAAEVRDLPEDPDALRTTLRRDVDRALERTGENIDSKQLDLIGRDLLVLATTNWLLTSAPINADQRAGLFKLLADAPSWTRSGSTRTPISVTNQGSTTTADGARGIAIRVHVRLSSSEAQEISTDEGSWALDFVIDADHGTVLETREFEDGLEGDPQVTTLKAQRVVDVIASENPICEQAGIDCTRDANPL